MSWIAENVHGIQDQDIGDENGSSVSSRYTDFVGQKYKDLVAYQFGKRIKYFDE